jgi:hypothetical protein
MLLPRPFLPAVLLAVSLAAACGGRDTETKDPAPPDEAPAADAPAADAASAPAPPADAGSSTTAPATVADIDRWQEGMKAELAAVHAVGPRLKSARTGEDTLSAMMAAQESGTWEAGAKAAGLEVERYKWIRSGLSAATAYLTPHLGGVDTTILSPAQRDELRQSSAAQLDQLKEQVPPEVVAALRPRAAELRKQELELVGARLKAAGM